MPTLHTLSGDLRDFLGDLNLPGVEVFVEHNASGPVVDLTNRKVRLGRRKAVAVTENLTFAVDLFASDSTDLNVDPGTLQYQLVVHYPDETAPGRRASWASGWFSLLVDTNIGDPGFIATATPEVVSTAATLIAEMTQLRDETAATTDEQMAARVADADSAFRQSLTPVLDDDYTPVAKNNRHPLTGWYHVSGFGAVGDWNGTTGTDNLPAFQAAVAALVADGGKGTLYIDLPGDFWLSNGWLIDADDITVVCHPAATIRTTSATTVAGCTVTFMGNGVIGSTSAQNAVVSPQRTRAEWRGGRIIATGSGTLDNTLGFVRYRQALASDVTLDADRKAITAQYGVDGIKWQRIKVTRGGVASVNIEGTCKRITLRDIEITSPTGLPVEVVCNTDPNTGSPFPDNEDVLIENVTITGNANAESVKINRSQRVTIRKTTAPGQLVLSGFITDLSLGADNAFAGGITYGSSVTTKRPASAALGVSASWVDMASPQPASVARKGADGMVTITYARSNSSSANLPAGTVLGTVPLGYRPASRVTFTGTNAGVTPPSAPYLYIEPNGNILSGVAIGSISGLFFTVTYPAA